MSRQGSSVAAESRRRRPAPGEGLTGAAHGDLSDGNRLRLNLHAGYADGAFVKPPPTGCCKICALRHRYITPQ